MPTWLPTSSSSLPGLTTRPRSSVVWSASLQSGTAEHSSHVPPKPTWHSAGASMPPTQIGPSPQPRPSSAQSPTLPQGSIICPHAPPASAQVVLHSFEASGFRPPPSRPPVDGVAPAPPVPASVPDVPELPEPPSNV